MSCDNFQYLTDWATNSGKFLQFTRARGRFHCVRLQSWQNRTMLSYYVINAATESKSTVLKWNRK